MRHSRTSKLVTLPIVLALAGGCGGDGGDATEDGGEGAPDVAAEVGPDAAAVARDLEGTAPERFRARFETSEGEFVVEVHREWAPHGADRFYNLVQNGYFDGARFFRVIEGFMAQFGIPGDPAKAQELRRHPIPDDAVTQSNTRGRVTFAMAGPRTRTSQVFINLVDNSRLDEMDFAPFGEVVEGMDVVDALHAGYGEGAPRGEGPSQRQILLEGNEYLNAEFPELDYVERATIAGS